MSSKVSVIVPIYNVEKYLIRCIESIINQTYENMEIILVDDGSRDRCAYICDEYLKKDKRVKVIHKKNGGLSDARNAGLEIATGEYIGFVDSDDYISIDMYEKLMSLIELYDADIASCAVKKIYENESNFQKYKKCGDIKVYTNEEALKSLIQEQSIKQTVWNKVYKKSVIKDIKFEVGKIHEDEYWTYQILGNAKKIAHTEYQMYYYLQREGSIMSEQYSEKRLNSIYSRQKRLEYLEKKFPDLSTLGKISLLFTCIYNYQCLLKSTGLDKTSYINKTISFYAKSIKFNKEDIKNLNLKQKIWFIMAKISLKYCCKLRNFLKVGL